jgi:hypothetical protein
VRLQHDLALSDYFDAADETTRELLAEEGPWMSALTMAHDVLARSLWAGEPNIRPAPAALSFNAFTVWLAALRTAFSGHEAAVYPLLRTALESACYAFLMIEDSDLDAVWLSRHEGKKQRAACRRAFTPAAALTAKALGARNETYGELTTEAYERVIDFGAHPNPQSVLTHLSFVDAADGYEQMRLTTLYGASAFQTRRCILACLDFAIAIALVLAHALAAPGEEISAKLQALNDAKLDLAAEFGDAHAASRSPA